MITNSRDNPAKEENRHRLNREIRVPEVRVTMPDGTSVIMNTYDALHKAEELGVDLMDRVKTELGDIAQVEQNPKLEGRQMIMVLGPKRKK